MKLRSILIITILILIAFSMPCTAVTINVNESGWWKEGEAFNPSGTPIQAAINAAIADDFIMIESGTYSESTPFITTSSIWVDGGSSSLVNVENGCSISGANSVTVNNINFSNGGTASLSVGSSDYTTLEDNIADHFETSASNHLYVSGNYVGELSFMVSGNTNYSTFYGNNIGVTGMNGLVINNAHHNIFDNNFINSMSSTSLKLYGGSSNNTLTSTVIDGENLVIDIGYGEDNTFIGTSIDDFYGEDSVIQVSYPSAIFNQTNNRIFSGPTHSIVYPTYSTISLINGTYDYKELYLTPSSGYINLTNISQWSITGAGTKRFNISASASDINVNIVAKDFATGTPIQLNVNELDNGTVSAVHDIGPWKYGKVTHDYTAGFNGLMRFELTTFDKTGTAIFDDRNSTVYPNGTMSYDDWVLGQDAIITTVVPSTGSIVIKLNASIVNVDYENSNIGGLNISDLNETLILKDSDVTTMMFSILNNKYWSIKDIEYHIGATSNRIATSAKTWTTSSDTNIIFTLFDLYPSSNFDCQYNSISFTTNTSNNTGKLLFNKSTWDTNVWRDLDIYMTTTPYRCANNDCTVDVGDPLMIYLDLNNSNVVNVDMEITDPLGATTLYNMTQAIENGSITWYYLFTDTDTEGAYTVDNFYSTEGVSWKQLDSFLTFGSSIPYTPPGGYSPGGPGAAGKQIIEVVNETMLGDLTLTPPRLDTYFFLTSFDAPQTAEYTFIANRKVESCSIEPNDLTSCEIEEGYIIKARMIVNSSTESYIGKLTVVDESGYTASADIIVRIVDLGSAIPIAHIPVGGLIADILSLFFVTADGALVGIRIWALAGLFGGLIVAVWYSM